MTHSSSHFLDHFLAPGQPLVQVEQVSRLIGPRTQPVTVLDALTFDIPTGSLFAITGPSGSGKSTLLHLLTGLDRPSAGHIRIAGQDLGQMREDTAARWRGRHVGVVFQFFQLLPTLTAQENVLLALELGKVVPRRQWRSRAQQCLERVGLAPYARRLPSELSGGQQQRVAIARALANEPALLVADEPTGNLDSRTAAQVFDVLAHLTRAGTTVLYVTHDQALAARATARIALFDGRIVGAAGTQALIASPTNTPEQGERSATAEAEVTP
ncbi:MAG TPA: ABC transporter ATP-binding protein [Ktedonobacterales bacterium]|nr:ABC transporter ATP-binding protein [Ktedonobacterales bacterium]